MTRFQFKIAFVSASLVPSSAKKSEGIFLMSYLVLTEERGVCGFELKASPSPKVQRRNEWSGNLDERST